MSPLERELKLTPMEPDLLDRLADLERFGDLEIADRHVEEQANSFFDTSQRGLRRARLGLRRRSLVGQTQATWTLKAEGSQLRGVATRPEVEIQLDAEVPPALAVGMLGDAARQRGAAALAEQLSDALGAAGLPAAQPVLETRTRRRVLDVRGAGGARLEVALDDVRLVGHPAYAEQEIEVELRRGPESALDEARAVIESLGVVRESSGSKLSRALAHLAACTCPSAQAPRVDESV